MKPHKTKTKFGLFPFKPIRKSMQLGQDQNPTPKPYNQHAVWASAFVTQQTRRAIPKGEDSSMFLGAWALGYS